MLADIAENFIEEIVLKKDNDNIRISLSRLNEEEINKDKKIIFRFDLRFI